MDIVKKLIDESNTDGEYHRTLLEADGRLRHEVSVWVELEGAYFEFQTGLHGELELYKTKPETLRHAAFDMYDGEIITLSGAKLSKQEAIATLREIEDLALAQYEHITRDLSSDVDDYCIDEDTREASLKDV